MGLAFSGSSLFIAEILYLQSLKKMCSRSNNPIWMRFTHGTKSLCFIRSSRFVLWIIFLLRFGTFEALAVLCHDHLESKRMPRSSPSTLPRVISLVLQDLRKSNEDLCVLLMRNRNLTRLPACWWYSTEWHPIKWCCLCEFFPYQKLFSHKICNAIVLLKNLAIRPSPVWLYRTEEHYARRDLPFLGDSWHILPAIRNSTIQGPMRFSAAQCSHRYQPLCSALRLYASLSFANPCKYCSWLEPTEVQVCTL